MHKKERRALIFAPVYSRSLLLVVICVFSWPATLPALAKEGTAKKSSTTGRFDKEIAEFESWDQKNAWPRDAVLFVGSSSIRLWKTAEAFPELPVINRGFGGSTIADANHYFDRVVSKYKPRAIVFYSGDNDIASGDSAQDVCDDFEEFVQLVQKQLPKTPIYFISIKPSIARQKMWPEMKIANSLVSKLASLNGQVHYVDVAAPMLGPEPSEGESAPPKDLFLDDGLHLNSNGYKLWTDTLAPHLKAARTD
jgi:lysophospholipase L1-like esterase